MNFKEFMCEWYDICYEIKDITSFFGERPQPKTITKEL